MTTGVQWLVAGGHWPTHAEQSEQARRLLEQLVGFHCVVEHDAEGAPYRPDCPGKHISISHCSAAVAVAVSDSAAVGIDVEARRRMSPGLVQRVCTAGEQELIRTSDDPEMAFLALWTRKEAVLKCRGTGIKGFGSMVGALSDDGVEVRELDCGLPDVVAALAVAKAE